MKALGTYQIARICQVTPPTVWRWVEEGKLPFFKTGGGHRRVWAEDLAVFLKAHNIPVPPDLFGADGPLNILVVDDDEQIRRTMARIVRKVRPQAKVHEAADGFEAGQKATRILPKLMILDLKLPGIDGIRMCRLIRQSDPGRRIKILVVTGYVGDATKKQALEAGADDFLAKPFEMDEFAGKIEFLLRGEPAAGKGQKKWNKQ
ncbi:MAG: response regulator [Elusimicrobiota bacterium]